MILKVNLLSTFAILGFSQLITTEAQLFNLTTIGNNILSEPAVNWAICSSISFVTTVFNEPIEALLTDAINGTNVTSDVGPYEQMTVTQVRDMEFNGCAFDITVDFELEYFGSTLISVIPGVQNLNPNPGYARIVGVYEPGLTFFASNETALNGFIPGVQACIEGLDVEELKIEQEGTLYQETLREVINAALGDPECAEIYPGEEEEEEEDEEDSNGDGGNDGGDNGGDNGGDIELSLPPSPGNIIDIP